MTRALPTEAYLS